MKILLTQKEKKEYFLNALCNGLDCMNSYGIIVDYNEIDYAKAKNRLEKKFASTCFEDVLLEILVMGRNLLVFDEDDEDNTKIISLQSMYDRMPRVPLVNLVNVIEQRDDAEDADIILQTVFFNEVIYG